MYVSKSQDTCLVERNLEHRGGVFRYLVILIHRFLLWWVRGPAAGEVDQEESFRSEVGPENRESSTLQAEVLTSTNAASVRNGQSPSEQRAVIEAFTRGACKVRFGKERWSRWDTCYSSIVLRKKSFYPLCKLVQTQHILLCLYQGY